MAIEVIEKFKETYEETVARKRAELQASIESGAVEDPITGTIFTIATLKAIAISAAVSAAVSAATYGISRALAPKPPTLQQGRLQGSLQLQNSEQGIMIPEIYGARPATSLVVGANPTYQNVANCNTSGGGGSITKNAGGSAWNAGASHNVAATSGVDAWYEFTIGTGYACAGFSTTASPVSGNTDFLFGIQWNPDGSISIKYSGTLVFPNATTWVTGDRFRIEKRSEKFHVYKGSAEIKPTGFVAPAPAYPLYLGIAIFNVSAGISEGKVQIGNIGPASNAGRGGIKVPAIIVWSSKIRKNVSTTTQPTGGGKGGHPTQTVENITYDIDVALEWAARGPYNLLRQYANADVLIDQVDTSPIPTGVYDPGVGADSTYDPTLPPDPQLNYITPIHRVDGNITTTLDDGSGSIQNGASQFKFYAGTATQDPDPTIEADIDAKYGSGSTPAYRNHAYTRHTTLQLSRWGGVFPNMTAVLEHRTLNNLSSIYASLCERVNVKTVNNDYDFSSLSGIASRGMLIAGRLFAPAEVIGNPDIQTAYNYFVTEAEGQILGYAEGTEPSVTIADTEIGWLDNETDLPDVIPEVTSILASEITLSRQVDVKFIDPDFDWAPNTQSAKRQITQGVQTELLEVQLALLSDEARAVAERKLYRDYVAGTAHKFTLPWTYLYLYPGYRIIITRAEGFTHTLRLTSISGGLGVLECEGVALVPESFYQPATGQFPPGSDPNVQVPAMTIVSLLDTPLLRDGDETNNNGIGFYMCGTPRTGLQQSWTGFALYVNRNNVWNILGDSNLPGTIGTVVSATGLNTSDTSVIDRVGKFTVDLYGTTAVPSSITETELLTVPNINLALCGSLVLQFATATQLAGFPNRWELTTLLNGRRGTESHISDTFTGQRFVLLDGAVKFVPMDVADIGTNLSYRAVTNGQSLADAAIVSFPWTGQTLKPFAPVNVRGTRDASGNLWISWIRRSRISGGLRPNVGMSVAEETERYKLEFYSGSTLIATYFAEGRSTEPVIWLSSELDTGTLPTIAADGSVTFASGNANLISSQIIDGDFMFDFQANSANHALPNIFVMKSVARSNHDPISGANNVATVARANGDPNTKLNENLALGAPIYYDGTYPNRIQLARVGSVFMTYRNYAGPQSPVEQISQASYDGPVRLYLVTNFVDTEVIVKPTLTLGTRFFYSVAAQTKDFGSTQSSLKVRISEFSAIVGYGDYIEITI